MENRIELEKPKPLTLRLRSRLRLAADIITSEKATEMLSDEHRVIERVLAVLQKLTTRAGGELVRLLEEGARFL